MATSLGNPFTSVPKEAVVAAMDTRLDLLIFTLLSKQYEESKVIVRRLRVLDIETRFIS